MGKSGNPARAAEHDAEQVDPQVYDPTPVDEDGVEDFDAFWLEQDRDAIRIKVMGDIVTLPPALPLQFEMEANRLANSRKDRDIKKLVGILFGKDAMTRWAENGMDLEMFEVLLAYAPMRIAGEDVTLAGVRADLRKMTAEQEGSGDPR